MKWLAAILSLYIMVLTAVPCCVYDGCERISSSAEHKGTPKNKDADNDNCGTCSPFFCHTCSGFIVSEPIGAPAVISLYIKKEYRPYSGRLYADYISFLWQPPDYV